jgi:division protein CdvB (Snf7/Vps24/ESCRT-III family)
LTAKFTKKWGKGYKETALKERIKDAVRSPEPLKPRLDLAVRRIDLQIQKLDKTTNRLTERDKSIFDRIVRAYSKHDMPRANVFANELAGIRKMEKMIMHSRLALEQIALRLSTVSELGDVVTTLGPAVGVLRSVRDGMSAVFPEAERELGQIGNLLGGMITDVGQNTGVSIDFETANDDAQNILDEAATVAEHKINEKFPALPAGMPTIGEKTPTET